MRSSFFNQLINLENKLAKIGQGARTFNWEAVDQEQELSENEEVLLRNTFLNSKPKGFAEFRDNPSQSRF
jgi:hypothetical protein